MKRSSIVVAVLINAIFCSDVKGQDHKFNYENFDVEVLKYIPAQRDQVTDDNFKKGSFYLEETRKHAKGDPKKLDEVDFWNITMAFVKLKEPKENIGLSFRRATTYNPEKICEYIRMVGKSGLDTIIPNQFKEFEQMCSQKDKPPIAGNATSKQAPGIDLNLATMMNLIVEQDIRFRNVKNVDWTKQRPLDLDNQKKIDSLYNKYKTYIGKSLVGKDLQGAMWLVVQHSNLNMMEKYLPIIQVAVKNEELNEANLKMLIDRIYAIKYRYQVFGSQGEVKITDEQTRKKIADKYGIK